MCAVFHKNQVRNVFVAQVAEREAIRLERHKERERQHRIAAAAPGKRDKLLVYCLFMGVLSFRFISTMFFRRKTTTAM